ncbi:MAG: UDP-N-acetylmuramoyl-tripeptide--D-alanyl-D-alanine ligase [Lachnospiraceae bacterium]|nr:UDP-N-acetylmuramoyl-tripeptide--D-alanyl-D-alanine ligase [Lachnospiraceae bacterium]
MDNIYVKDLVLATNGELLSGSLDLPIKDMVIDSRQVSETSLFVPIKGEKVDAHKFIADVLKTCNASLTMDSSILNDEIKSTGKALIKVDDSVNAMQAFAEYIRSKYSFPIIGVTGSVGKTTTREMIAKALSAELNVLQTYKNYNSQVGVPMMISRFSDDYDIAVLEMGMSNHGEMERLAKMIKPDTAVMTLIGVAHIEQLKSQDGIYDEKINIVKYMSDNDIIFLNGDDAILRRRASELSNRVLWYGLGQDNDYKAYDLKIVDGEQHFYVDTPYAKKVLVKLKALGEHNVRNALVALANAELYKVDIVKAAEALYDFSGQRQQVINTDKGIIIDDSYNASPESMKASISVLAGYECKGKRVAVLADMLELGENEIKYHKLVGEYLKEYKIDYLIAYGELAKNYLEESAIDGIHLDSLDAVYEECLKWLKPANILLFKGSNGMNLKEVVNKLQKY